MTTTYGTVWLVGAGPGDPGLLTVRARELLAECDCVVVDALVSAEVRAQAAPGAVAHFVGKRGGGHSATQAEINDLLVRCARAHRCVVRLKGGDPFVFGRGGEEALALAAAGVPFAVVPGVTAGVAVPACAGIPITHRAASSAVAFVTGHEARDGGDGPVDWSAVARIETLVLYMGMHRLAESCAALIAAGRDAATPAAVIQWGTRPEQRTVTATLADIAAVARAAGLGAPAITVIGEVVRYRERIRWFDGGPLRPLHGRTVLVTRARDGDAALGRRLAAAGARVIDAPLARYADPDDPAGLDAALRDLGGIGWVAFTSANAVRFTAARLDRLGRDARAFAGARIAAVGPGTARALAAIGLRADLLPASSDGTALANALLAAGARSVLIPQSQEARPELAAALTAGGVAVRAVTAYRVVDEPLPAGIDWAAIDAAPMASAATVRRLVQAAGAAGSAALRRRCRFAAIGPVTAAALAEHGLPCHALAAQATIPALADAVVAALAADGPAPGTG